ncbi:MAG: peptidoglycan editing factor PgeF [Acidobacteriota bacterium]
MDNNFQRSDCGTFLYHQSLEPFKWLRHGFSLRRRPNDVSDFNLGFNGNENRDLILRNRRDFVSAVWSAGGKIPADVILVRQIHSNRVITIKAPPASPVCEEADGLVSDVPGVLLGVQTADCMPVLIAAPQRRAVAVVHAGWRGTAKRIAQNVVARMKTDLHVDPADCLAVVGPCIRSCCYEVGLEVLQAFRDEMGTDIGFLPETPGGRQLAPGESGASRGPLRLDLPAACLNQLLEAGLKAERIFSDPPCTACHQELFFSHRAESGRTGRMIATIGLVA